MERGYIKLWRKTLDSGILQHPAAWQLFGYLLLKTSHRPHRQIIGGAVFDLAPGQVVFGRHKAAADLCLSEKQVRTALDMLKKLEIVACEASNRCTIVSFVNWHRYQEERPAEGPAVRPTEGPAPGQQTASTGPAAGHKQALSIKNILNTYMGEAGADAPPSPATGKENIPGREGSRPKSPYSAEFELFWEAYPKKRGKDAAFKAWEQRRKKRELPELSELLAALGEAKRTHDWSKEGGRYVPYPATWLNQGRWADDYAEEAQDDLWAGAL